MRRQLSEAGKSRPTLGAQAHLPCGVFAPGESQGPTTSAGGPSARRPSQRSPRAPCPWPQDGAVVQGTRGPAGHLQDREPGPTRSGRSREGDPQIPESGCGGDSPLLPAPRRIGEAGPAEQGLSKGSQAASAPGAQRLLAPFVCPERLPASGPGPAHCPPTLHVTSARSQFEDFKYCKTQPQK